MATVTWLTTWGNHHTDRPSGQPDILFFLHTVFTQKSAALELTPPPHTLASSQQCGSS